MGQEKLSKKKDFTGMLMCIKARNPIRVCIFFAILWLLAYLGFSRIEREGKK